MKAVVLSGPGAARYPKPCPGCQNKVKAGEAVLAVVIDDVSFNTRNLAIHVDCIRSEIADMPATRDANQERYEALRDRIVADGTPFPKVTPILPDKVEVGLLLGTKVRRKAKTR